MQDQYTIDTVKALKLIHEAEELIPRMSASERDYTRSCISSVVSVVALYLRIQNPMVPHSHALAVADLQEHIQSIKEPKHAGHISQS